MSTMDKLGSAVLGTRRARRKHAQAIAAAPGIASGIEALAALCKKEPEPEGERPIFLLSAGWRAGSTLLQRLIMSDPDVLLWGEPYDECGIVQALAGTVKAFRKGWPPEEYFHRGRKPHSAEWVANLFPEAAALRSGYRAFFDRTFAEPARRLGMARWGIKEVRLTAEHAHFLRWLYPQAKFVFLYRNPLNAYRSYCGHGRDWYELWPDRPVFTPRAFGRHWRALCEGFLREQDRLNAIVVRYEDLVKANEDLLRKIERHLEVRLERSILVEKIGSSAREGKAGEVGALEKALLRRAVSPLAQKLGYDW